MSVRDVVALASASPFDCSGCSGTPEVVHDAEDDAWDCYRTKTMLATYDGVVEAQRDLDELIRIPESFYPIFRGISRFGKMRQSALPLGLKFRTLGYRR